MTTAFYSHIFSCLYDEPAPIGRLGRSAHHSVFRSCSGVTSVALH
ncbi:hypothetical protein [Azospirillum argentinense]|nr:hypothetical protein [Azospirillum argentinense]